ncbi:MAG TPA: class I SAM-dependent methyltransferase [Solirubrobacterales bacterium]|jgi:cyclopropane fatty-acyl-phospholipid synthase-like methyltransferase|nr:class I SAM-dependent methyltransferase [Solirubrobacterales bacterium]
MQEWSDPKRVAEYLSREIPHRQTAEAMLLQALPERVDRFLDLGTGDGRLVSLLRSAHPDAKAIGLDSSEPMLARARERFDGEAGVEFRLHDLRKPLPADGPFDAIVSGLAIHHLEDDRKRTLFAEIRSLLVSGGVFANLDLVKAPTPDLHERFRHEIGRPEDDPADRLADLHDQLDWLRAAGFADADCQFKWLQLTLVVAA